MNDRAALPASGHQPGHRQHDEQPRHVAACAGIDAACVEQQLSGIETRTPEAGIQCRQTWTPPTASTARQRLPSAASSFPLRYHAPGSGLRTRRFGRPRTVSPLLRWRAAGTDRGPRYRLMGSKRGPAYSRRTVPSFLAASPPRHSTGRSSCCITPSSFSSSP